MAFPIFGHPKPYFTTAAGAPAANWTLTVLEPADDTNKNSYPTADDADAATNANTNPVVLNARGEVPTGFFGVDGEDYKVVLKDDGGNTIWTSDDCHVPWLSPEEATYTPAGGVAQTIQKGLDQGAYSVKRSGALGDNSNDDTDEIQAALDTGKLEIYLDSGTYLISSALTMSTAGQRLYGPGTLKANSATGSLNLLQVTGAGCRVDDITIDMANTDTTFAAGYVASRNGLHVKGTSNASYKTGFYSNNVTVKNCGEAGVYVQYMDEVEINNIHVERCGQYGIYALSVSNMRVNTPFISDIYPGNSGTTPYLNAYGITFTNSGSDNVCTDCEVNNGFVEFVVSWEAYDTHAGKRIRFNNCSSYFCNQGIAIESTTAGSESEDIQVIGGTHNSFGQTYSYRTKTYEPSSAIIANMGSTTTNGKGLLITGVHSNGHGSGRDSSNGAITVQDAEDVVVTDNLLINSLKRGIACINETKNALIDNNNITGVTSVGSVSRGIEVSSTVGDFTGSIGDGNTFVDITNQEIFPIELTISSGAVTAYTGLHTVDTEADAASDDLDTINGGWEGRIVTLCAANNARTVVVKDGTGNLRLAGDFSLTHSTDTITLRYSTVVGDVWMQLASSDNET